MVGELAKELEDGPRTLRVEARRGFVEEDEEGGLGGEFDSDRETLALLDVESHPDVSDYCLGVRLHLEESEDLLDVGELLGLGSAGGLTKEGGEAKSFADGTGERSRASENPLARRQP